MVLFSNHSICFGREVRKIIFIYTLLSEGLGISSEYALFGWKKSSGREKQWNLKMLTCDPLKKVVQTLLYDAGWEFSYIKKGLMEYVNFYFRCGKPRVFQVIT